MYGRNGLNNLIEKQLGQADSLDPRSAKLFEKMFREPKPRGLGKLFQREVDPLLSLEDVSGETGRHNRHFGGSKAIDLQAIHGTIDRDSDFDYDFHPTQRATEMRWCKVASAMLRGIDLPLVELVQVGEHYFVKDGHHRISVARALGYGYIDAVVDVWEA